jgi:hypothetical protein
VLQTGVYRQASKHQGEMMNQHKTKVIAFRVNADEYEAMQMRLDWCKRSEGAKHIKTMANLVEMIVRPELDAMLAGLVKERKKAEAKAKRQAKKEAASVQP